MIFCCAVTGHPVHGAGITRIPGRHPLVPVRRGDVLHSNPYLVIRLPVINQGGFEVTHQLAAQRK